MSTPKLEEAEERVKEEKSVRVSQEVVVGYLARHGACLGQPLGAEQDGRRRATRGLQRHGLSGHRRGGEGRREGSGCQERGRDREGSGRRNHTGPEQPQQSTHRLLPRQRPNRPAGAELGGRPGKTLDGRPCGSATEG